MTNPPIALWVVPVSDLGGVARHVLDVAAAGIPGYRVVVVCPPGPLAAALREKAAAVTEAELGPSAGTRRSVAALRALVRALRPTIVHTHLSYADVIGALAVPRHVRLVSTEHGIAADDLVYHGSTARARAKALMHRGRLRRFDALIACSNATRGAMIAKWHAPKSVVVIHNGVDAQGKPERRAGLRIGSLSRLSSEKQIDRLIDAFTLVHREHPEATLSIAGDGPLRDELERQVQSLRLPVSFVGFVDAASYLGRVDVIAQLSVWENCSYTLLDAVVRGVGVVAADVGGNPEILPPRSLVDATDRDAVARALVAQGERPDARPELPPNWPSVSRMCASIAASYGALR